MTGMTAHNQSLAAVSEGHCPRGHGRLTTRDLSLGPPVGWCTACGCGWSNNNGTLNVTLIAGHHEEATVGFIEAPKGSGFVFGPDGRLDWTPVRCNACLDTGHVCENHPDRPWGGVATGPTVCTCGGAGMPCTHCCDPIPEDGSVSIVSAFMPRSHGQEASDG